MEVDPCRRTEYDNGVHIYIGKNREAQRAVPLSHHGCVPVTVEAALRRIEKIREQEFSPFLPHDHRLVLIVRVLKNISLLIADTALLVSQDELA